MKKIFDWTAGSFFRTIGRVIAFSLIGYLIAMLLQANDFKLSNLFFTKVKAETFTTSVLYAGTGYFSSSGSNVVSDDVFYKITISNSNNIQRISIPVSGIDQTINIDYVQFNILYGQPNGQVFNYTYDTYNDFCTRWNWSSIDSNNNVIRWDCDRVQTNTNTNTGKYYKNQILTGMEIYAYVDFEGGGYANCNRNEDNLFVCPTERKKIIAFNLLINFPASYTAQFQLALNRVVAFYVLDNSINNAINNNTNAITNQTQQQQQQHQEIMDDNTTQAEDEATSFFEDFDVPDVGGLSAIITAPLNTIRSLLNSTCTPLVLPLPFVNQNLTLPCLTTIYSQHFGAFFTLYQTIILAIVAYRCIRSIFFDIHGFTDPSDDRIEVMDL